MKTQIIQLSPNEDHISVREKMGWSQAERILLVWPEHGRALRRKLDLILVSRQAKSLGAQLALVTHDAQIRFYASQLGISVFEKPIQAEEYPWSSYQVPAINRNGKALRQKLNRLREAKFPRQGTWLEKSAARVTCLVVPSLAILTLVIFLLPSARVDLVPRVETQSMVFDIIADPQAIVINYSTGSLPTYARDITIEASDKIATTGTEVVSIQPATGNLRFTNYSDQAIEIQPGTIISTVGSDPVRFITTSTQPTELEAGETILLSARAILPGPSGNLAEDQLVVIEDHPVLDLVVTNPRAMSGGSEISVPAPTTQDLSRLRLQLMKRIMQEASTRLQSAVPEGDFLILPTVTKVETLEETSVPSIGEPGNQLELNLKVRIQAQVVSSANMHNLVNPIMNAYTPTGYRPIDSTLEISQASAPVLAEDGKARWSIRATRQLQANLSMSRAAQLASGKSIRQAQQRLESALPLSGQANINVFPSWWPRLPFLAMRIEVTQEGNP